MTTAVRMLHSSKPPRYMNPDIPLMNTHMATIPASATTPAMSRFRTAEGETSCVDSSVSCTPGHTNESQAPMSNENARVSVP